MGKIVMPKNSALLHEIEAVLKIYYDKNDWMANDDYKTKLKAMIGEDQYQSSYTKKAQITSYFGFTIWENIRNAQSRRRITESGKKMYEAICSHNTELIQEILMTALETTTFGRNNYGCPDSNSDVEPPSLYIRAILDLGYLTYREFAFLLWKLEDLGANYTDSLGELRQLRINNSITLGEEANKYTDCKPIMILERWGFLAEDTSDASGGKHIIIAPEVLNKYRTRLRNLKIYNIDMDCDEPIISNNSSNSSNNNSSLFINNKCVCKFPRNRIIFGAPGTGKSYTLNNEKDSLLADGGEYERVTFHPDYSYANFVGTYKPVPCGDSDENTITYSYVPGPFMRTYVKALKNSRTDSPKPFLLIIEEINRANVAAVFGDVFQLLDRGDDEISEYPIQASEDIKKYLADELGGIPDDYREIRIPDNMFIWATMNSADQGVFPMDTAFKRRWDFTYLGIDDNEDGIADKKVILGQGKYCRIVEWNELRKAINEELLNFRVNEDKLMGPYFISKKHLSENKEIDAYEFTRIFKNKVIMYLFDDAAKQKRSNLFNGCEEKSRNQYSRICKEFDIKGVYIFCEDISKKFIDNVIEDNEE